MHEYDPRPMALHDELECGVILVESGIRASRALVRAGDDYYSPLFLLSNGFERLLKASICYALLERDGDYPSPRTWRPEVWKTHSPRRLLAALFELAKPPGVRVRGVFSRAADDATVLGRLWQVIDEQAVADQGRYHTLDVVLGRPMVRKGRLDPAYEWQSIETEIAGALILAGKVTPDGEGPEAAYGQAAARIADEIGWLTWAIASMFAKWALGVDAHLFADTVRPLLVHKPPIRLTYALLEGSSGGGAR